MEDKILHYIAIKYILFAVGLTIAKNEESLDSPSKILSENPVKEDKARIPGENC